MLAHKNWARKACKAGKKKRGRWHAKKVKVHKVHKKMRECKAHEKNECT